MENYGPGTEALISFCHDLDQSFLIARLVSYNGKSEINELMKEALELQQDKDFKHSHSYRKHIGSGLESGLLHHSPGQ